MGNLVVWWTTESDCRIIDQIGLGNAPPYIKRQFESRYGRNGRGRLWAEHRFHVDEIEWDDTAPGASVLAQECGGIVIEEAHVSHVSGLPGYVTDLRLLPALVDYVPGETGAGK